MPEVKNKKPEADPPGFLDFLVDVTAGFWSGLVKAVPNIFDWAFNPSSSIAAAIQPLLPQPVTGNLKWPFTDWMFVSDPAGIGFAADMVKMFYRPEPPKTLEEVDDYLVSLQNMGNMGAATLLTVTSVASLIPIGHLAEAIDEVWRIPWVRTIMDITYDAAASGYYIGLKPLIRRHILKQYKSEIPEPYRIADFWAHGQIDDDTLVKSFEEWGLSDKWAWAWAGSQLRWLGVAEILQLYWRGYLSEERAKKWMRWSGYSEEAANAIFELAKQIPSPAVLAELWAHGLIDDKTMVKSFEKWGLADYWAWAWAQTRLRWLGVSDILELYWRGYLNEDRAKKWMRWSGYSEEAANAIFELAKRIPPASDLITMCVREAFNPEVYERWAGETPPEFIYWMKKQGFSEEWSRRYWVAHYRRMGVTQAYRAFYRGYFKSKEELDYFLKVADIHPDDRLALIDDKVLYEIPTIRELGYGYDVGVYTKEDIKRYRQWAGLSPDDAEKAAEAMVAYRTEAEREAVRRELMYLYALGKISEDEFRRELEVLKTRPEKIDLWVKRAQLYRLRVQTEPPQNEARTITRSDAIWAFERGLRDEAWLRRVLADLGYSETAIDVYVDIARWRREERERKEAEEPYKKLTLSQIEDALKLGLITEDVALDRIKRLGYSDEDAKLVLRIISYTPTPTARVKPFTRADVTALYRYELFDEDDVYDAFREMGYDDVHAGFLTMLEILDDLMPKIEVLYRKAAINDDDVIKILTDYGLTVPEAQRLLKRMKWELSIERLSRERDLTKSEIIKGVKSGVLTFEQGVQLLVDLGYNRDEATYILVINGIVAAGDPLGYWEMRRAVELAKKARGLPYREIPDEVIMQERLIEEQRRKIEEMRARGVPEEELAPELAKLTELEDTMRKLLKRYLLA